MDASDAGIVYQSTFRNTPLAAIGMICALLSGAAGWAYVFTHIVPISDAAVYALEIAGVTLVLIILVSMFSFRKHQWTVTSDGLSIVERPYFPWLGWSRRAAIPFAGIAALRRIESGFDSQMEVETKAFERYRLSPAWITQPAGGGALDNKGFEALDARLRSYFQVLGPDAPVYQDGFSFWNKPAGLSLLGFAFAFTLCLSGFILWSYADGVEPPRGAAVQGIAIVLLLPVFAGYALLGSLRRRSSILMMRDFVATAKRSDGSNP